MNVYMPMLSVKMMMYRMRGSAEALKPIMKYEMGTKMRAWVTRYGASTTPVAMPKGSTAYIEAARSRYITCRSLRNAGRPPIRFVMPAARNRV